MVDCYVGLGGNFKNTLPVIKQVVSALKSEKKIEQFTLSRLYRTTPVNSAPPDYLNAVCRFQTQLPLTQLWQLLQTLEKKMGKREKPKDFPRLIDLDLLFYGSLVLTTEELTIPHPRWHERLFVLAPLADVTDILPIEGGIAIKALLQEFPDSNKEKIFVLNESI